MLLISVPAWGQAYGFAAGPSNPSEIVTIVMLALAYVAPTFIAFRARHKNWKAILMLNIFAFTIILWVVAFVWALKRRTDY